jgi:large subunit ribosomal protein L12
MELVYAALLLHSLKKPVDEQGIEKIVHAAGAEVNHAKIKALVGSLHGVNIDEAIKQTAVMAAAAAPAAAGEKKAEAAEEEKGEEQQEKKAEEAAGGLSSLFG